jgi:hypothetical protein
MKRRIITIALSLAVLVGFTPMLAGGQFAGGAVRWLVTSSTQIKPGAIGYGNLSPNAIVRLNGATGATGATGLMGPTGPMGAHGNPGTNGVDGVNGAAGPQGVTGPQGSTGAQGSTGPQGSLFNYEVDNGSGTWNLANLPLSLPNPSDGYLDAGIVLDVGQASSFNGISTTGTGDSLVYNVWIANGSDAYTLGQHEGSNFCYGTGSGTGSNETFYMQGNCDTAGSTLTVSQIQSDFAGYEAYAWVGLDNNGTTTESATITSVNGTSVNATVTLNASEASVTG